MVYHVIYIANPCILRVYEPQVGETVRGELSSFKDAQVGHVSEVVTEKLSEFSEKFSRSERFRLQKRRFSDRFQSISLGFGRLLDVFSWFSSDFSLGTALSASDENIMRVETGVEKALALRMLTCSRFI